MKHQTLALLVIVVFLVCSKSDAAFERRNSVSHLRGPYNTAFFHRENESFHNSAAIHFAHGKAHDILQLTPLAEHEQVDRQFDAEMTEFLLQHKFES